MTDEEKFNNDYEYSRETLYELIDKGREGIEDMINVARESEHPRAYEVLSKLIKDVGDVTDKLMALDKAHKDLHKQEIKQIDNTTNNIFIGSTTELQRFLKSQNEEKDITPIENGDG
jgi:hypothetical protein